MHKGAFDEGKAARILGRDRDANPYRRHIVESASKGIDVAKQGTVIAELASDWESGWVYGTGYKA
jgi:hypothetical protein